jgi:hypothetical protein
LASHDFLDRGLSKGERFTPGNDVIDAGGSAQRMFRQDATDRDAVNDCIKAYRAFAYVNAVNVWKQNIHFNLDR